jgi:hypothetical protein
VLPRFEATVRALGATIVRERCGAEPAGPAFEDAVRFALARQRRLPDVLRLPSRVLTLAFGAAPLARAGRPFHRLSPAARRAHVERWRRARAGVRRDLIRYWESLVLLAWFSRDEEAPGG